MFTKVSHIFLYREVSCFFFRGLSPSLCREARTPFYKYPKQLVQKRMALTVFSLQILKITVSVSLPPLVTLQQKKPQTHSICLAIVTGRYFSINFETEKKNCLFTAEKCSFIYIAVIESIQNFCCLGFPSHI